jgi:hypothetical protein
LRDGKKALFTEICKFRFLYKSKFAESCAISAERAQLSAEIYRFRFLQKSAERAQLSAEMCRFLQKSKSAESCAIYPYLVLLTLTLCCDVSQHKVRVSSTR